MFLAAVCGVLSLHETLGNMGHYCTPDQGFRCANSFEMILANRIRTSGILLWVRKSHLNIIILPRLSRYSHSSFYVALQRIKELLGA